MICLSGFELYSRWVPLENLTLFKEISILGTLGAREFFFIMTRWKIFFPGSSQPLNFRPKQQEKPSGTQGTYLASWISQVQNTDYYELPSITFLANSLDKSWNLENIMNLYVGWREGLGMNGSKKRNKWKFVSTPLSLSMIFARIVLGAESR